MKKEEFKEVKGYEGLYMVSNHGRVFSMPKIVDCGRMGMRQYKGKILKGDKDFFGHIKVRLYKNKKSINCFVHRLVALSFIKNKNNKPFINHIDSNPANNYYKNLEWCTAFENMQHASRSGRLGNNKGEINGQSKLKKEQVLKIRKLYNTGKYLQKELGKMFNVNNAYISQIVNRITWSHI